MPTCLRHTFGYCLLSALALPVAIHLLGPLIVCALSPAVVVFCRTARLRQTIGLAWITGTVASFLVQHTLWSVSLPGTFLLASYQGISWIFVAVGARTLWRRWRLPLTLTWPLLWCGGEVLRTFGPLGTLYGTLAVPKTTTLWMLQIVDLGGAAIAAFPLAALQGWFADCALNWPFSKTNRFVAGRPRRTRKLQWASTFLVGILCFVSIYGHWRLQHVTRNITTGPPITVIATDILALPDGSPSYDPQLLQGKLRSFSEAAAKARLKPAMIVWPEGMMGSAVPNRAYIEASYDPRMDPELLHPVPFPPQTTNPRDIWALQCLQSAATARSFQSWVQQLGIAITLGMNAWLPAPKSSNTPFEQHNAAVTFDPDAGQSSQIQSKCRLYPLGEYAPWKDTVLDPLLGPLLGPPRNNYQSGKIRHRYQLPENGPTYTVSLCSELKFDHLRGRFPTPPDGQKPYDFHLNLANEGLFQRNGMPEIFAFCAVLRAIEQRVTVARSSNSGISGFWSPTGQTYGTITNPRKNRSQCTPTTELDLIQSLIAFRRKHEPNFATDPALRTELDRRILEINEVRKNMASEGWSTHPIQLFPGTTLFQSWGVFVKMALIAFMASANLSTLKLSPIKKRSVLTPQNSRFQGSPRERT